MMRDRARTAIVSGMNGTLVPCSIIVSPENGGRHIALTREMHRVEQSLIEAGWRHSAGLWMPPADLPGCYAPPQTPLGVPLRGFLAVCLYCDRDHLLFGESERGAHMFLLQAMHWQQRNGRWVCPAHELNHE
jgi:hypothetical protein